MASEQLDGTNQRLYDDRYKGNYMDTDNYSQWTKNGATALKVRDTLIQVQTEPRTILDFGCGVGGWTGLISGMHPNANVSGVDISSVAIDKAIERYPNCEFSSFDGSITPYPDESFDLVFSFHVLEHVQNIDNSISEISRLLKKDGFACIIFPCGNKNSLQEMLMSRMRGGILPSEDGKGRSVHFFEIKDGHVRRMFSDETIRIFKDNGLTIEKEFYAAQVFGWIDWLCRGTGPDYIKKMFSLEPVNFRAKLFVYPIKNLLLGLNWIIRKKNLNLVTKRNIVKQSLVFIVKYSAMGVDQIVKYLSELEWKYFKTKKNGSAQYLLFVKT